MYLFGRMKRTSYCKQAYGFDRWEVISWRVYSISLALTDQRSTQNIDVKLLKQWRENFATSKAFAQIRMRKHLRANIC